MEELKNRIKVLISNRQNALDEKIKERRHEMEDDNNDHYLIYNLLGIKDNKGYEIDLYQNIGRFLYRQTGELLEEIALETILFNYPDATVNARIPNNISDKPDFFQIDALIYDLNDAIEIKWRDATTDGDHIRKERNALLATIDEGYNAIRVMFFYPNRQSAIRVQDRLREFYEENGGHFYSEESAWDFIHEYTGVDLKAMLIEIAEEQPEII